MSLIEIKDLKTFFSVPGGTLHAVDGVCMSIEKGKTMGVVGESGCGKTTLGRTILHLEESTEGKIYFNGEDYTNLSQNKMHELRRNMQIIFQDPYSSLNPRLSIEDTILESIQMSKRFKTKDEVRKECNRLLNMVGIDERLRYAYPHELDGGRRQRVVIARALAMGPQFLVCDEPVSALDVSIQAQVLNLLQELQEDMDRTYMFITHDLSVVRHISDNISVMYLGQLVECSETDELFDHPLHPYTKALLSAIPSIDIHHRKKRIILKGELVSPIDPEPGCRFAPRCQYACERCLQPQQLREISEGHFISCCRAQELSNDSLMNGKIGIVHLENK